MSNENHIMIDRWSSIRIEMSIKLFVCHLRMGNIQLFLLCLMYNVYHVVCDRDGKRRLLVSTSTILLKYFMYVKQR